MIAPDDLTVSLLVELIAQSHKLTSACVRANRLDRKACEQVCEAGARIAQLLGITVGVAGTDPPSTRLVEVGAGDAEETLDMPVGEDD